ncbi:ceramidase domain-containing protein [Zobellella maritima]|uniref:ceramidase domain-containing protein n=1 Tax=Zobellella maritima TaxID=2059725 RepID=UPI0018E56C9A|nr:ceramidase domain-containing protein [Zobellella maritima]
MMSYQQRWRYLLLWLWVLGSLALVLSLGPLAQNQAYHEFADQRTLWGLPHALNILSNLPLLVVGCAGLLFVRRDRTEATRAAWQALFAGLVLVSAGSAYYHWQPSNETLLWDRLPMTIGFMGLFIALLGEYLRPGLARLLVPALLTGLASVFYWYWFDDLRPYIWVQFMPLLSIPLLMMLFDSRYSHGRWLLVALAWYGLAKLAEVYDLAIYQATDALISGHTLKHLLAAASGYSLLWMLQIRTPVRAPTEVR